MWAVDRKRCGEDGPAYSSSELAEALGPGHPRASSAWDPPTCRGEAGAGLPVVSESQALSLGWVPPPRQPAALAGAPSRSRCLSVARGPYQGSGFGCAPAPSGESAEAGLRALVETWQSSS